MTPWTVACQAPLSMEFSRQDYWSGLPFSSPRGLPDPGIIPASPAWQADSLPLSHLGVVEDGLYSFSDCSLVKVFILTTESSAGVAHRLVEETDTTVQHYGI